MRAAFIATHPSDMAQIAASKRRRDLPKGRRELAGRRKFRSLAEAMRHGRERAA